VTESIRKDAAELRGFVENVLDDVDSGERRTQLLGCVARLEDLATRTTRSGIGPSVHLVKASQPAEVHCGRLTSKVNCASENALAVAPENPAWCQRCVQLYQARAQKRPV
jgi:hypothetical protein